MACNIASIACDLLPTEEARKACKEITESIKKGKDPEKARRDIIDKVGEDNWNRAVEEAINRLGNKI